MKEYLRKGESLSEAGDFEGALDNFNRGLALQPADIELLIHKTSVLLNLNLFSEALETIDKALNLDQANGSDLGNMYAIKGHALVGIGKHEEALIFYRKCLNLVPDSSIGWYMQGAVLYGLGQREDAIKSLEHARDLEDSIETNLHISDCYMDLEEYSKAAQNYRSMLEKGWTNPFNLSRSGSCIDPIK